MVCRAGWGEEDTRRGCVKELGNGRNRAVTGSTLGGGGKRRLVWRAGDACAMNQLSKYGPCSSSQHAHPLPVQSGWTSPPLLPVYLPLLLPHAYHSTLLTMMEESSQVSASHTTQYLPHLISFSKVSSKNFHTFRERGDISTPHGQCS